METRSTLVTPTHKTPLVVDRLRPGELEAAALMLARSFVREPFFAWLFEGHEDKATVRATMPWFRGWIRSFAPAGHIHTARRGGELVGVAIRTPPGTYPPKGLANGTFMARLIGGMLRMRLTSSRAFRTLAVADASAKLEPKVPFWHLAWVGVPPDHAGTGVGAALADEAIRVIDGGEAPAWLLTFGPHTRALYQRRGFRVQADFRPVPEGPAGWTMVRDTH